MEGGERSTTSERSLDLASSGYGGAWDGITAAPSSQLTPDLITRRPRAPRCRHEQSATELRGGGTFLHCPQSRRHLKTDPDGARLHRIAGWRGAAFLASAVVHPSPPTSANSVVQLIPCQRQGRPASVPWGGGVSIGFGDASLGVVVQLLPRQCRGDRHRLRMHQLRWHQLGQRRVEMPWPVWGRRLACCMAA